MRSRYINICDGRTDRQTDRLPASRGKSIAYLQDLIVFTECILSDCRNLVAKV